MNNFTLVIPTHNRHSYLKRSIEYYKNLKADVIYCDSSLLTYNGKLYSNIKYLHLPEKSFSEKILISLDIIKTDFVALCADDDFIIINSLYEGNSFLSLNTNFKTIVGNYVYFKSDFDGQYYSLHKSPLEEIHLGPEMNAEIFFQNYHQILWAMYHKDILKMAFQIIQKAEFKNDNFIELVIGACSCYYGGIKILKEIWGVREIASNDEHWGARHIPISYLKNIKNNDDYLQLVKLLSHNLTSGYANLVIENYLRGQKKINIINELIKKIIPKILIRKVKEVIFKRKSISTVDLEPSEIKYLKYISILLSK